MICPICKSASCLIHRGTRDNSSIDVYECSNCKTKFLSDIGNRDYTDGYMNGKLGMSQEQIDSRLKSCYADDKRRADRMADLCKGKRICDFGCGFGGYLSEVKKIAAFAGGVDLGADERKYLEKKNIVCKDVLEKYGAEKFDVITLFHVFEHLDKPKDYLRLFAAYLEEGGLLALEVPNGNDALLSVYGCSAFADFTYWSAHLFLYNAESIRKVIEEAGCFEIEKIEFIQRYSIGNHLTWLAKGVPGGELSYLESDSLKAAYEERLRELEATDTLFVLCRKKERK